MTMLLRESAAPLYSKHKILPLTEDVTSKGRIRVEGPSQKINARNKNGRVYPESVWEKNLAEGSDFNSRLKSRLVLGELEHPESGNTRLGNVSHLIEKVWVEDLSGKRAQEYGVSSGRYVMTRNLILNTPSGQILRELFEVGVPVGTSSRGRGNVRTEGQDEIVQDDYNLKTWDYVEDPSVEEAHHKITEAADLPGAGAPPPPDIIKPEEPKDDKPDGLDLPTGSAPGEIIKQAETLVRELEDAVTQNVRDVADLAELFCRALDILDQLGGSNGSDDSKVRGQILTLSHVLGRKIGGKDTDTEPKDKDKEKDSDTDDSDKKRPKVLPDEEDEEEEEVTESMDDLVVNYLKERGKDKGDVYRGEIEGVLNRFGHKPDEPTINELAQALRKAGYQVKEKEYGKTPTTENTGRIEMSVDAKAIIKALSEKNAEQKKLLESLKDAVPASKFESVKKLCAKLIERTNAAEAQFKDMEKRYKLAVEISTGLAERARKMKLQTAMNEAISAKPHLAAYKSLLEESADAKQLEERIRKIEEAGNGMRVDRDTLPPLSEKTRPSKQRMEESVGDPLVSGIIKRLG